MKKFQLASLIILGIAGLITTVLAILGLAEVAVGDAGVVLKWILVATLLMDSIVFAAIGLTKNANYFHNLLIASVCMGLALFMIIPESVDLIEILVCFVTPLIAACFGLVLLIKTILFLSGGQSSKNMLPMLILSLVLLSVGITFVILAYDNNPDIYYIDWLIIGIGMLCISTIGISNIVQRR